MGQVQILVGVQFGDEGKGKWIDILSKDAQVVARFQGGNNAGHTIYVNDKKIVLHQIPSGILQRSIFCALTAGVVVNPSELVKEIEKLKDIASVSPDRVWLSARAHVISPWHVFIDGMHESQTNNKIGTTKRGIGPTYSEKAARSGLRLGYFIQKEKREAWVEALKAEHQHEFKDFDFHSEAWDLFHKSAEILKPFVCDAEHRVRTAIREGKQVLLEGAQGTLLDLDHGTYPYVTSSSTAAGGAFSSIGLSSKSVSQVIGVAKAYVTRVGGGPMPTELFDASGEKLQKIGNEFGATTGRPRRCGWLDIVALRYSCEINGLDALVLNKMDVLNSFPELCIATQYDHPKLGRLDTFPWDPDVLAECKPVLKTLKGWNKEIPKSGKIKDLPIEAREYIETVQELIQVPIKMVGTGVNRDDALFL